MNVFTAFSSIGLNSLDISHNCIHLLWEIGHMGHGCHSNWPVLKLCDHLWPEEWTDVYDVNLEVGMTQHVRGTTVPRCFTIRWPNVLIHLRLEHPSIWWWILDCIVIIFLHKWTKDSEDVAIFKIIYYYFYIYNYFHITLIIVNILIYSWKWTRK